MQNVVLAPTTSACKRLSASNGCRDAKESRKVIAADASPPDAVVCASSPSSLASIHPSSPMPPAPSLNFDAGRESPLSAASSTVNGASSKLCPFAGLSHFGPPSVHTPREDDGEEEEEDPDNSGASLPPPPSPTRLSFAPHLGEDASAPMEPDVAPQRLTGPVLTASIDPASVDLVTQRLHRVMGADDEVDRRSIYHQPPKAADRGSAARLAKRLFHLDGFRLGDVFKHLCKKNDFSQLVGEEYLNFFDFGEQRLDRALRHFLSKFTLMGETQERERVLAHFSRRFMQCNPEAYNSEDACHTLVCAIMLLNTDLHGHNVLRKMSCQDFIGNLAELNNGENFDRDELKILYEAIKEEAIQWPQEVLQPAMFGPQAMSEEARRVLAGGLAGQANPFLEVPNPNEAQEYRRGYLHRKCVMDAFGKKTALGKRKWKLFFAVLKDLIIYLYKNEQSVPAVPTDIGPAPGAEEAMAGGIVGPMENATAEEESERTEASQGEGEVQTEPASPPVCPSSPGGSSSLRRGLPSSSPSSKTPSPSGDTSLLGAIRIHHALACPAPDYTKRANVVRLTTAEGAEYLLQAGSGQQGEDWAFKINFAAARLSAAPMAPAVGSDKGRGEKSWHRPLLPAFYTQCNTRDQLEQHQKRVLEFSTARQELLQNPPKKADKSRAWHDYNEKKRYLEFELERYKTYARILERHLTLQFAQPPAAPGAAVAALPALADVATCASAEPLVARAEENGGPMAPGAPPPVAAVPVPGAAHDPKAAAMVLRNQNAVYEII